MILMLILTGFILIPPNYRRIRFFRQQRLLALIFVAILMSSVVISPFSTASGYVITLEISEINGVPVSEIEPEKLIVNLSDGVSANATDALTAAKSATADIFGKFIFIPYPKAIS